MHGPLEQLTVPCWLFTQFLNAPRTKRDFDDLQEAYENKHKDLEELCDMYAKIGKFYDSLGAKIQKLEEVNGIPKKPKRIQVPFEEVYDKFGQYRIGYLVFENFSDI